MEDELKGRGCQGGAGDGEQWETKEQCDLSSASSLTPVFSDRDSYFIPLHQQTNIYQQGKTLYDSIRCCFLAVIFIIYLHYSIILYVRCG